MSYKFNLKCINDVVDANEACKNCECRHWIEYPDDLNCVHVTVQKHGSLKFQDIGERLNVSAARIKQIEQESLKKISKNKSLLRILAE
jgi:hypothetical protein